MNKMMFAFSLFILAACKPVIEKPDEKNNSGNNHADDQVFCTQDVNICPDGSAVARDPNKQCEFKPCPSQKQ